MSDLSKFSRLFSTGESAVQMVISVELASQMGRRIHLCALLFIAVSVVINGTAPDGQVCLYLKRNYQGHVLCLEAGSVVDTHEHDQCFSDGDKKTKCKGIWAGY